MGLSAALGWEQEKDRAGQNDRAERDSESRESTAIAGFLRV